MNHVFSTPIKQLSTGHLCKFEWTQLLFTSRRSVLSLDCLNLYPHSTVSGVCSALLLLQFASSGAWLLSSLPTYLQMSASMLALCPLSLRICRCVPPCWRCVCIKNKALEREMDSHGLLSCLDMKAQDVIHPSSPGCGSSPE